MRQLLSIAKRYIAPSPNRSTVLYSDAEVKDIITAILRADKMSAEFTTRFAPFLRGSSDMQTMRNIWAFVRKYVRYQKDKAGHEVVKSPGKTWQDRYADCKSMSVMIGSLLKNLGYPYYYKVVFYDKRNPEQGHIYPVAILGNGREVVVDAVHHTFDEELPYWKAYKYDPATGQRSTASALNGTITGPGVGFFALLAAGAAAVYFSNTKQCPSND